MPYYRALGNIPRKRHVVFRQPNGELYPEELMGAEGFSGPSSLLYHTRPPTRVLSTRSLREALPAEEPNRTLRMRHFHLAEIAESDSATLDRTPVLFNADATLSLVRPRKTDDFFYRNGQADEIVYVAEGSGTLESEFGALPYRAGDYIVVPRGILHKFALSDESCRMLVIESASRVRFPSRYLTGEGQLMEHAPFCERDIRPPETLETRDESGEFRVVVKQRNQLTDVTLDHHPLDVVGWDGCYYPFALSIHDFEPITGSLHQPPPVHQTFQADGFVVCSFVPRLFDFHPDAVPAPYNHANVMSDEVLFYANDEFMSRKGIGFGSLTLHPAGIPHGPHPGRAEASIGKSRTEELAVMMDTFRPLHVACAAVEFEDADYGRSWVTE
ncbi:MAG: homogentisate 1,2-dioxygenase [Planctomycetaceae bacterium]